MGSPPTIKTFYQGDGDGGGGYLSSQAATQSLNNRNHSIKQVIWVSSRIGLVLSEDGVWKMSKICGYKHQQSYSYCLCTLFLRLQIYKYLDKCNNFWSKSQNLKTFIHHLKLIFGLGFR